MEVSVYIPGDETVYTNYKQAVEAVGGKAVFGADGKLCDCLLLPGGGDLSPASYGQKNRAARNIDPERDILEQRLLSEFLEKGKPVLGICRGMQAINVFFGGDLIQDQPGHDQIDGTDRFHTVHTAPGFLRTLYGAEGVVNSAHHQVVNRWGSGLEPLQWAPDGVVEALAHKTLPVWAIQWHPERLPDGVRLYGAFLDFIKR